jgi:hypothetical protein
MVDCSRIVLLLPFFSLSSWSVKKFCGEIKKKIASETSGKLLPFIQFL